MVIIENRRRAKRAEQNLGVIYCILAEITQNRRAKRAEEIFETSTRSEAKILDLANRSKPPPPLVKHPIWVGKGGGGLLRS